MKNFFLALYQRLYTITDIQYIRMWNNQHVLVLAGRSQMFQFPAVFIEFDSSNITQLAEGVQLFDPLIFRLHIIYWQLDSSLQELIPEDTFEQNLDVYDLKDKIYKTIQKFQPGLTDTTTPVGSCIRTAEYQDYEHAGLYHYIQEFKTTYIDNSMQEPVGGSTWPDGEPNTDPNPSVEAEINLEVKESVDVNAPHKYTFDV